MTRQTHHFTRCAVSMLLLCIIAALPAVAVDLPTTWTGPSGGNWSVPTNWEPIRAVPPLNVPGADFYVTIGGTVTYDVLGCSEITGLVLECGSVLNILPDTCLEVVDSAAIEGVINVDAGSFTATTSPLTNATFCIDPENCCNKTRLSAINGGTLSIDAEAYSSKGLYTNWGVRYYEKSHTYDLITASGEGSTVDLSSLTTFDASFNSPTYNYTTQRVVATGGGFVNLSVSVQPSATTDGGRGGSLPVTT